MTHGSLFSGIGGFDLGFERAGFKTIWQVEIDDYARRVLAKNFPDAERFSDIRECGRHNLKPVDVISGGFPCQDISNAGKRVGIDGERSGLWSEMRRIVCELRPQFVIVENVSALLGRGMERVLGDLASSGYDAEWDVLPACAFGAPHIRQRVFIVAYPNSQRHDRQRTLLGMQRGQQACCETGASSADVSNSTIQQMGIAGQPRFDGSMEMADTVSAGLEEWEQLELLGQCQAVERSGQSMAYAAGTRWNGTRAIESSNANGSRSFSESARSDWWATESDVGRVAHGVPHRVERLKGLGNAVVPQIAEWIGQRIKAVM